MESSQENFSIHFSQKKVVPSIESPKQAEVQSKRRKLSPEECEEMWNRSLAFYYESLNKK